MSFTAGVYQAALRAFLQGASTTFYAWQVLAPLQWYDLLWVGGLPGLSEELLFRGALIPSVAADW